jgi:hypothetical protein
MVIIKAVMVFFTYRVVEKADVSKRNPPQGSGGLLDLA